MLLITDDIPNKHAGPFYRKGGDAYDTYEPIIQLQSIKFSYYKNIKFNSYKIRL